MKTFQLSATFAATAFAALGFGQAVRVDTKNPAYGTGSAYDSMFDPGSVVTFKAKIKGIVDAPSPGKGAQGEVTLLVKPFTMVPGKGGKLDYRFGPMRSVELGPAWFVDDQDAKLKLNDYVAVTASAVGSGPDQLLIARWIRHGHEMLALRESGGKPYWYAFLGPDARSAEMAEAASQAAASYPAGSPPTGYRWYDPLRLGPVDLYGPAPVQVGGSGMPEGVIPLEPLGGPVQLENGYLYPGSFVISSGFMAPRLLRF